MHFVTPTEVLAAIAHAGDDAFKIDETVRTSKGVGFRTFSILKNIKGTWQFVPLKLKFTNLTTKSRPVLPSKFPSKAQLQFSKSSASDAGGQYGKAKCAIYEAFMRIAAKLDPKAHISNPIQTHRKDGTPIDDPIIRVLIPCDNGVPRIMIHDLSKTVGKSFPIMTAPNGSQLTLEKMNDTIKPGSTVSGVDDMSAVCTGSYGISLPTKVSLLLVKPSKGFGPMAADVFNLDQDFNLDEDVLE